MMICQVPQSFNVSVSCFFFFLIGKQRQFGEPNRKSLFLSGVIEKKIDSWVHSLYLKYQKGKVDDNYE